MNKIKGLIVFLTIVSGAVFAPAVWADTNAILDQVSVALLGHTETILETTIHGKTNAEILATPIMAGKMSGEYLIGLDGGVLGNVKPNSIGEAGYNWTAGVHIHLSPLLRDIMPKIAPNYPAMAALEVNPRVSYLFRNRVNQVKGGWQLGLGIGWAFGLTPK